MNKIFFSQNIKSVPNKVYFDILGPSINSSNTGFNTSSLEVRLWTDRPVPRQVSLPVDLTLKNTSGDSSSTRTILGNFDAGSNLSVHTTLSNLDSNFPSTDCILGTLSVSDGSWYNNWSDGFDGPYIKPYPKVRYITRFYINDSSYDPDSSQSWTSLINLGQGYVSSSSGNNEIIYNSASSITCDSNGVLSKSIYLTDQEYDRSDSYGFSPLSGMTPSLYFEGYDCMAGKPIDMSASVYSYSRSTASSKLLFSPNAHNHTLNSGYNQYTDADTGRTGIYISTVDDVRYIVTNYYFYY